jgi:hypothetical protein
VPNLPIHLSLSLSLLCLFSPTPRFSLPNQLLMSLLHRRTYSREKPQPKP